jgi:NAD(P)-dependent dehydrogenase (short-subunit alcohol dehydrogenase family)
LLTLFGLFHFSALAKQLTKDYRCKVFLGSRNAERGAKAVEIVKAHNGGDADVELVIIDVTSESSVLEAAETLKGMGGIRLYGLVNNAGVGLNNAAAYDTNYFGTKRVTEAFLPLLKDDARVVMTGSGAGPMTVRKMPPALQKKFVHTDVAIMKELETMMTSGELKDYDQFGGYGVSKAMMHTYSSTIAKEHPKIRCYAITPGLVNTRLAAGHGATTTPEEGTESLRHCLFDASKEESGWYFGSDCKRSPVHIARNPGDPVFDGVYPSFDEQKE